MGSSARTRPEVRQREVFPWKAVVCVTSGERQTLGTEREDRDLAVFFGFTFGHTVLAPLHFPRALG